LLADFHPKGAVAEKFGMYNPERGNSVRSIVIIDKSGKVAWVKVYDYPNSPDPKENAGAIATVK
jgi:alkyl hydroperoxide reductase subunit AhpC